MKITIRNEGDDPKEVITIFTNGPDGHVATDLLEANSEKTYDWDTASQTRHEVVPWIRDVPPA